ncbi:MAG: hypothetical protein QME60_07345 [Verrucomicrobiota bacterium]|nr:hypothetical protein [Verrucomicrobiota bacterium]
MLGAGRKRTTDRIDHAVGLSGIAKIGERVDPGRPLAIIHANDPALLDEARGMLKDAFAISDRPVKPLRLINEVNHSECARFICE